jgi:hypothetical protein
MSTIQVIARRVGLEVLDYKQILVEKYKCDFYRLGEVKMVDGRLDVTGDVNLSNKKLTELPFKFGKVKGFFWCDNNKLTSLEGAPLEVGLSFHCNNNKLTSLEGAPLKVGGHFICFGNNLPKDVKEPKGVKGKFIK